MLEHTIRKYNKQDKMIVELIKESQEENNRFLQIIESLNTLNPKVADKYKEQDRMIIQLIKESQEENNRLLQLIEGL